MRLGSTESSNYCHKHCNETGAVLVRKNNLSGKPRGCFFQHVLILVW